MTWTSRYAPGHSRATSRPHALASDGKLVWQPNRGRIRAKVCEDQSMSIDPCSDEPYQTFNL